MYIPRLLRDSLEEALRQFPAVLVTGPRQSGKTTFLKQEVGERFEFVTFDDPLERDFARRDPRGFLGRFQGRAAILDEIQYVPEILGYLKMQIDAKRDRPGRWLLTGSQQFELMRNVTESLAGRVAILELLPFSGRELSQIPPLDLAKRLWIGGYPELAVQPDKRDLWVRSYLRTYVERDVRQLRNIGDLRIFEAFLAVCAARHGQTLNMAALSRQLGVSAPTIKDWISVLEASYVLTLLPPWHANYGKRVIRSPKVYFADPALACTLTRQSTADSALAGPLGGPLLEGWIVNEAVKGFTNRGRRPEVYHWRSHDGLEVDLLIALGPQLLPVEIKATATPRAGHLKPMDRFRALLGDDAIGAGLLVCQVEQPTPMPGGNLALPWAQFGDWLDGQFDAQRNVKV
jgi:uncharacterized protein